MWRDTLGETADEALAEMTRTQDDQQAFARAARRLLAALDLAEAESEAEPEDNTEDGEEGGEQSGQQDDQQDGSGESESEQDSMLGANPEEMEGEAADDEGTEARRRRRCGRRRRPPRWPAATARASQSRQRGGLSCLHTSIRRRDRGRGTVRSG